MAMMNDMQRYFIEEFVEEYREGHMSRRDMIWRVLLITGSVGSAATTLPAMGCSAGRTVEIRIEPGAGHTFFRNGGQSYNAAAARDAWPRTLDWFAR